MPETLYLKQMECGPMQNYVYLIGDPTTRQAAVVDPAWDVKRIVQAAQQDDYTISKVLITHTHQDHTGGDLQITLLHTPGHTPGSQCFLVHLLLNSAATLFNGPCRHVAMPNITSKS